MNEKKGGESPRDDNDDVSWAIGKFYTSFSTPFLLIKFSYKYNSYIDDNNEDATLEIDIDGYLSTAHI